MTWNEIEGLTLQEQNWLDELAHGYVTPENFAWIVGIIYDWNNSN